MEAHRELTLSMQKEIELMREMLANLHQEELSLLMHDKQNWSLLMQERSILIERLSRLRLMRMEATKKAEMGITEEISTEIFTLRDQMLALIERTNVQSSQNEILYEQMGNLLGTPITVAEKPGQPIPRKKASVATYDLKR